ncbi:uncharacterized protein UTRI_03069 [Ustilago trichophora]|uniref:Mid2 domain-containing protein n=1 Tax=Ustilago trichophora TaxID=86804 RepID=A0A5C3E4V7_9BASI|nr:uncharacterized protein UTRI_03069 [Ustilago trichophora]
MVKFRSWMESRCMAMQLALCLLIGLRLVSASLQQSTCGLRKTSTSASSQQDTSDQHRIAPPTSKWSVEMLGSLSHDSKAEHHRDSTERTSSDTMMVVREASGTKRSLKSDTNPCRSEGRSEGREEGREKHRTSAEDHLSPCPPAIAADSVSDPGSTHFSATSLKQTQFESSNNVSSSSPSNPFSSPLSPSSDSLLGSSGSDSFPLDSSSSAGSGSSGSNALSSSSFSPSSSLSGSSSISTNSDSPLVPSPTDPDPSTPMSSSLPDINYGTSKDNSSSPNPTPNQSPTNSTLSNGNLDSPTDQAPPSQTKTTAVVVGVTVPVGVIAMGLVALAVLHKQRQRRKKMQSVQSVEGARDEEMVDTPATQQTTLKLPLQDATSATPSQAAIRLEEETDAQPHEGSDQESNVSHTTASSQPVPPAPSSSYAHESRSGPTESPRSVGAIRGNTLKRKPVPALLETFEPAKMSPHPATNASQDEEAASLPVPGTSEGASSVGHSRVDHTGASS